MKKENMLKTGEASDYLGVSKSTMNNWVKQDSLTYNSTPGGHYLFSIKELNKFADERGIIISEKREEKKKLKILVIDDDASFREFVSEALELYSGYELKEAQDGTQGVLLVKTWMPDLIILDLRMPNMNGIDFCHVLKKDSKTKNLKIIITSAYLAPIIKNEIKKLGIEAVLEKPVRLTALIKTISELVELEEI